MAIGSGDQADVARVLEDLADAAMIEQQRTPITGLKKYVIVKYRSWSKKP
jgi:hypothetical protein